MTTNELPSPEALHAQGKLVVDRMNHREYILNDVRYFVGFQSPQAHIGIAGGWLTYKAEPTTPACWQKCRSCGEPFSEERPMYAQSYFDAECRECWHTPDDEP